MSNRRVSLPGASELFRSTAKHNSFSDTDKAQDGLDDAEQRTSSDRTPTDPGASARPGNGTQRHGSQQAAGDASADASGSTVDSVLPPRKALPRPRGARPDPAGVADGYVMMRRSPSTSVPRNSWHWRMHVCSCVPKGWQPIEDASYGKPSPSPWPTSTFAAPSPHWSPVWTNET